MSPTKADIDTRDIQTLKRIPQTVLCIRIGNPDDQNSRFQFQFHTSPDEYVIPKIHQFEQQYNPIMPKEEEKELEDDIEKPDIPPPLEEKPKTAYECKGINIIVHYVKQYMPQTHIRVQCTLYDGTSIVKTEDGKVCNWATKPLDSQNIINTRNNNPLNAGLSLNQNGIARGELLAVDDETTWIKDLYKLQWDNNRTQDIMLVVQIMEYARGRNYHAEYEIKQDYASIGYGVLKVNNFDGTIRYGTYEIDFYKPPVNLTKSNNRDALKFGCKITIGQPHLTQARPQTGHPDIKKP